MNPYNNRFHTVRVVPTCTAAATADGKILFLPTEIPNVCPKNSTAMLKQIVCHVQDDVGADIELAFFSNSPTTEALNASSINFLALPNTGGNATDTEVENACPLGSILLDRVSGVLGTDNANDDAIVSGEYSESRNYTDNMMFYQRNINMPVWPGGLTSVGATNSSSIYVMGIATDSVTYTASGLIFYFTFEY